MTKYYLLKSAYADGSEESDQIFSSEKEAWKIGKETTLNIVQDIMDGIDGDIAIHFDEKVKEICISVNGEEYSRTSVCLF